MCVCNIKTTKEDDITLYTILPKSYLTNKITIGLYGTHQPKVKCVLHVTRRGDAYKTHNTQAKNAGTRKCDGTACMCVCKGYYRHTMLIKL